MMKTGKKPISRTQSVPTEGKFLTLRRPLRRKLRIRWFFDVSKVKESSYFKSDLTDPPQIFDAHLLDNTDLSPSRFHFSVGFISRSYIIHTNQPLMT